MNLKIEVQDSAVRAWMAKLVESVADPRPALDEIGAALRTSTYNRFRNSRDPSGAPWNPLSAVTLALRRKGKGEGSAKPLLSSGDLANSIHAVVDANSVTIGTNKVYGAMQHFGAKKGEFGRYSQVGRVRKYGLGTFKGSAGAKKGFPIPWGDIPPRPFLGVSNDDRREIITVIRDHLAKAAQ